MRLMFYKLPSEAGENVVVTDNYAFTDSELAIQLDDADLDLPYYDLMYADDERSVTLVEGVEANEIDPYMVVDSTLNVDATLPFRSEGDAERFLDHIIKWQEFLNKAYDE